LARASLLSVKAMLAAMEKKMARHTVTVKDIDEWMHKEVWHLAAASSGNGSLKKLEMSNAGMFRVTDHDDTKYFGGDKNAAVDAYNAAQ
jgi:hypothetical protein